MTGSAYDGTMMAERDYYGMSPAQLEQAAPDPASQSAPEPAPANQPQAEPGRPRDDSGRWMSEGAWERRMLGDEAPAPVEVEPTPAPATDAAPAPVPDESQRRFEQERAAFEQQRQEFEQQRQRAETEQQVNQFRANWEQGRQKLLERVKDLPADQAIAAVNRYGQAERDAYLHFQGQHLSQREQAAQSQLQTLEQQQYQSKVQEAIPGYVPRAMAAAGINDLTPDESARLIRRASQAGGIANVDAAIADEWQHYILPQREMQRRIDQLSRTQQVDRLAAAGVYAVSGGTGQPAAARQTPRGGYASREQLANDWYS